MVLNHSQYLGNNSRGLSEIAHDMQYVNLNKSQKDFYKTLVTLVNNSTTPVVDEPIDPIVYTSPQKDTTQIYN
jgi:hypothetical protein